MWYKCRSLQEAAWDEVARFFVLAASGSDHLAYAGNDIRADIREAYEQETSACAIAYKLSDSSGENCPLPR